MTRPLAILLVATTALCVVQPQSAGTDCNGKTFLCLDNQRYQSCSQSSSGQTQTVDTTVNQCPANQVCSNTDSSACSSSTTTTTSTTSPTTTTTTDSVSTTTVKPFACETSGRFPHETDCHDFYICLWFPFSITKIQNTCLFGMVFDPVAKRCTQDWNRCTLHQPPFNCVTGGYFPDPSDSSRYFVCRWDGMRYELLERTCWLGFTFNPALGKCNGLLGF